MNLAISATFVWLLTIGFTSGSWWPLFIALGAAICLILAFRVPVRSLATSALLLCCSIALLATRLIVAPVTAGGQVAQENAGFFGWLREAALSAVTGVNGDAIALTLGLSIGDSSLASPRLLQDMKLVSLTHLVAVSGANCAIVVAAVYLLLRRLSIRSRVVISLAVLVGYVALVGFAPSVLRASVMAAAVLLAQLSGRKSQAIHVLSLSAIVLLIADPALALSFSFSLSVASTFGILLLAPELANRFASKFSRPISLALAVSVAAQIMCLPILLQLQPGLPTYSILANLICEPLVAPITLVALLAVVTSPLPILGSTLFWLASLPAAAIAAVAHFFAGLPLVTAPWFTGMASTVMALVLVMCFVVWVRTKSKAMRAFSALAVLLSLLATFSSLTNSVVRLGQWPQNDWQIVSCDVGQGDSTVIRSEGSVALVDVGRDEAKIDSCLGRLGISKIDLLVLTHYDVDHVGGLAGALRGRTVLATLLTPFVDDRPAALITKALVDQSRSMVRAAESGLSGRLGRVSWQVLSPTRHASEAEDSNDASTTMLFRFDDYSLITLADLGEKGQMRLASDLPQWRDAWVEGHDLVMKVSHHGSADQYFELLEELHPAISLISVGANNGYGHPTKRTLSAFESLSSLICRTDLLGSIAISRRGGAFAVANLGAS